MKITLRLEKNNKYIEKRLTPKMVCALFDLQYMDSWADLKLNKIDKEISQFFRIIEHIDSAMHGNKIGYYNHKTKKMVWGIDKSYMFGKPKWRDIK